MSARDDRLLVELRPPRTGERFLPVAGSSAGDIFTAEHDWSDLEPRWVVMERAALDELDSLRAENTQLRAALARFEGWTIEQTLRAPTKLIGPDGVAAGVAAVSQEGPQP